MAAPNTMGVPVAAGSAPGAPAPQAQGGFVQPGQAAQASPLAQTFTAWFRGPGLTSTALSLAIVLGSAAISAILTMVAMSTTDSTKTFPTTFSTLPLLMGWSLGGQFVMSGSNSYETITLTFTLLPMGALTAAGIGVFWLARRRAAVDGSAAPLVPTLARAGAEALAVALVACLVTAPFSMTATMMGLKVMTVSSSALMTILLVTVVVFVALVVARSGGALIERLPRPVVQLGRELGALSTALGVVLGVFVVLAYIVAALTQGWNLASILLLPVFLPNLVLLALGMGSLGGVTLDKSEAAEALAYFLPSLGGEDGDSYAWTWFGSWSILLFAAMIVAIAAAAVRVGVRRARTGRIEWARVWQLPLVSLVLGAIVFYGLLPLRFSGADTPMRSSGGGAGLHMSVSMQPNVLTFFLFGVVVAIVSVLAELLPLWVYSVFPAVLQLVGGKKASAAWRAGTSGVRSTTPSQQWAYSTDPATGASIAMDPATGAVFSMDPATGQWVETTPASQAPAPGLDGAATAGTTAAGALPEPAPMNAASRKKVILGLSAFGVVVALVVAGVVALNVVNGMRGPDKAVESYLTLLSEGKAAEATKMVDPGVPNDQRKLLTDDALKAAKARIKVTKIDKPTISGDSATVKAHLSLDGKAFEYNFTASKTSGSFGLDSWKVDKPLVVSADFSSSLLPGLKVAGVAIDLAKESGGWSGSRTATQFAYPGVYPVAAPDSVSKYLTAKEASVTLIPSGQGASSEAESVGTQKVDATPTDELKTKALEKVKEQTKTCATVPTNMDNICPFQTSSDMTSLSVEKDATKVEFSEGGNDLSFTSDEINISGSPKPTAFDKNPAPRKVKFTFSGKVELPEGDGEPTVTIDSNNSIF